MNKKEQEEGTHYENNRKQWLSGRHTHKQQNIANTPLSMILG